MPGFGSPSLMPACSVASLVSSNLLLVVSLAAAKLWLLDRQVHVLSLAAAELAVGAGITLLTALLYGRRPFDFLSEVCDPLYNVFIHLIIC